MHLSVQMQVYVYGAECTTFETVYQYNMSTVFIRPAA